jgi:hypothetical protein
VPASQVVTAVPERQRRAKPPKPPRQSRPPAIAKTLRKALAWRQKLDSGVVASQADIAQCEGITHAQVTQILMLLRLTPEIQKHILDMPKSTDRPTITECNLRPIALLKNRRKQAIEFKEIFYHHS